MNASKQAKEKRIDLIFAAVALVAIVVMLALVFRYAGLRSEKNEMTDGYASVTEELIKARQERSDLESEIEKLTQELNELSKELAALGGD